MASRCISTLNDLDKISSRIYYKHSKGRFRAGIEAKLKAAREKVEQSSQEIDEGSSCSYKQPASNRSSFSESSTTLSSRYFATSASTTSRSVTSERQNKVVKDKTSKPSTTKSTQTGQKERIHVQRRKTKSCPSYSLTNNSEKETNDCSSDTAQGPRTASVFGKYNGKGSEYKPTAWFNLLQGASVGVIDYYVCEAKKEKPLCYSINVKKGETVPNLLRNNLEVRVGQNGVVRMEKSAETMMSEVGDEDVRQGKKRTAPLSWEEQLNWQNACIISSEPQTDENSSSKGLCETHPVIFHEKRSGREKDTKRSEDKNHSPSYKLGLESRWVYADRRNLVSTSDKCITSVEIEDTRSGDDAVVSTEREKRTAGSANASDKERKRNFNAEERSLKKVSFKDEGVKEKAISIETAKDSGKIEVRNVDESPPVSAKTTDTEKVVFVNDPKSRPKTCRERSRREDEEATRDVRELRRPHTAPTAPPSTPRGHNSRLYHFMPIKIPTSQGEEEDNNFLNLENKTNEENRELYELSESSTPTEEKQNDNEDENQFQAFSAQMSPGSSPENDFIQDGGAPKKHVSFGVSVCKSAPVSRTVSRETEKVPRARSSTPLQRRSYKPSTPVVIESESSLELPKDLPPAQALVALRKKIRDDLAQQNRELQLDIQQLYLRKHSE